MSNPQTIPNLDDPRAGRGDHQPGKSWRLSKIFSCFACSNINNDNSAGDVIYIGDTTDDFIKINTKKIFTCSILTDLFTNIYRNILNENKTTISTHKLLLPYSIYNYTIYSDDTNYFDFYNTNSNKIYAKKSYFYSSDKTKDICNAIKKNIENSFPGIKIIGTTVNNNSILFVCGTTIDIKGENIRLIDYDKSEEIVNKNKCRNIVIVSKNKDMVITTDFVNEGVIFLKKGSILEINGSFINRCTIINEGTINITSGVFINEHIVINKGKIKILCNDKNINQIANDKEISIGHKNYPMTIDSSQTIMVNKNILYNGTIGIIENRSLLFNTVDAGIKNTGKICNENGVINNMGEFFITGICEKGELYNRGNTINIGKIVLELLSNHKNIYNYNNSKTNTVVTDNYGKIINSNNSNYVATVVNNNGDFINSNKIIVKMLNCNGTIINKVKGILIANTIINMGNINNYGSILNNMETSVKNKLISTKSIEFVADAGENYGIITNNKGGTIITENLINRSIIYDNN